MTLADSASRTGRASTRGAQGAFKPGKGKGKERAKEKGKEEEEEKENGTVS